MKTALIAAIVIITVIIGLGIWRIKSAKNSLPSRDSILSAPTSLYLTPTPASNTFGK